ncbi:MAG: hypothetical protein WBQ72_08435 [Terriglobales bacterium]|jgi:hypothetical protein
MESTGVKQAREIFLNPDAATAAASLNAAMGSASAAPLSSSVPGLASAPAPELPLPRTGKGHSVGYGMPCSQCRAYYPADMDACPICQSTVRVSPGNADSLTPTPASRQPDPSKVLAEETERLRQLKAQIYASHPQVPATIIRCALGQNHSGEVEPAAVCHSCYDDLRQKADRMEAALHFEVKDAGKIVYDAVWADTSDPNKTYLNAAGALLAELRKRARIE